MVALSTFLMRFVHLITLVFFFFLICSYPPIYFSYSMSLMSEFEEIEQVQRQLGVAMAQLSTTLKHFEVVYGSIGKLHIMKRQMYIDMELLNEEKEQMEKERLEFMKERDELLQLKKEVQGLQIEKTADSLLVLLKSKNNSQEKLVAPDESEASSDLSDEHSLNSNISANTYSQVGINFGLSLFNSAKNLMK
eukprot:NODE_446_length_8505_cov_0.322032.p3 type:complete len:192 gc:universal NODE_446_length_8505_cov_0.322032:415-990(+)